nr:phage terminase large subunit family protein [Bradyrhizobium manausense]
MKKADVACPHCGAGFQRIELSSMSGTKSRYECPVCDTVLEVFDGSTFVAYRLVIQPTITKALRE